MIMLLTQSRVVSELIPYRISMTPIQVKFYKFRGVISPKEFQNYNLQLMFYSRGT